MLIQSHNNEIELLPALPDVWKSGKVKGLCARGGFVVDIEWENGKMVAAVITPSSDKPYKIKYRGKVKELKFIKGKSYVLKDL